MLHTNFIKILQLQNKNNPCKPENILGACIKFLFLYEFRQFKDYNLKTTTLIESEAPSKPLDRFIRLRSITNNIHRQMLS